MTKLIKKIVFIALMALLSAGASAQQAPNDRGCLSTTGFVFEFDNISMMYFPGTFSVEVEWQFTPWSLIAGVITEEQAIYLTSPQQFDMTFSVPVCPGDIASITVKVTWSSLWWGPIMPPPLLKTYYFSGYTIGECLVID